jgi:hypothetical protein
MTAEFRDSVPERLAMFGDRFPDIVGIMRSHLSASA